MSIIEQASQVEPHTVDTLVETTTAPATAAAPASPMITTEPPADEADEPQPTRRRRLVFWICRYLPAEVSGTAAMIIAGVVAMYWTDNPALIAIAAVIGESIGFYLVLAFTIYGEQWAHTQTGPLGRRRAVTRTFLLLLAEFGPAELLDTLLIRPAALMLGVWLIPDPVWGLLIGKIAADIVFYAIAAGAFTVTDKAGLRDPSKAKDGTSPIVRLRQRLTGATGPRVAA